MEEITTYSIHAIDKNSIALHPGPTEGRREPTAYTDGKRGGDSLDVSRKWGTNTPPGFLPYYDSCDPPRLFILCPLWLLQHTLFRWRQRRRCSLGPSPANAVAAAAAATARVQSSASSRAIPPNDDAGGGSQRGSADDSREVHWKVGRLVHAQQCLYKHAVKRSVDAHSRDRGRRRRCL